MFKTRFLSFFVVLALLVGVALPAAGEAVLDGTTDPVDNSTALADGTYTAEDFSFSGGSGKIRIVCDSVAVESGEAYATIRFVSKSGNPSDYRYVKASGDIYYPAGDASFTIPVALNQNNRILGLTAKMSSPHEVEYMIYVQLGSSTADTAEAPEIMGLIFQESIETPNSSCLRLYQYSEGVVLAAVTLPQNMAGEDTSSLYQGDTLNYLLVPADVELAAGLEEEYIVVQLPVESVFLMDEALTDTLTGLDALSLVSVATEDCRTDDTALSGGTLQEPNYRNVVLGSVDVGLMTIQPLTDGSLTAEQYRELTDRFSTLGIPLIVDCSAEEPDTRGRAEWLKLYGILLNAQETVQTLYGTAVAGEENS